MELQAKKEMEIAVESEILNGFPTNPDTSSRESIGLNTPDVNNHNSSLYNGDNSDILTLLKLYKSVCKQRLSDVDDSDINQSSKSKERFHILKTYLEQVEEQNALLASTMIELEKEAKKRVKEMEKRLKSTAKTTMEAVINIHEYEKEMRRLVEERISMQSVIYDMQQLCSSLKIENSFLQDQNCNLNHDLQALLHVVQHARSTGHWEMNCVTFCEVTPEQIFGPVQSLSHMYSNESPISDFHLLEEEHKVIRSDLLSQDASNSRSSSQSFNNPVEFSFGPALNTDNSLNTSNKILERKIEKLEAYICELQHKLTAKESECECHLWKIELLMQHNQNGQHVHPIGCTSLNMAVQKCISLPDIGNIYSYANILRKSHSCRTSNKYNFLLGSPKTNHEYKHVMGDKCEHSEIQLNEYSSTKREKVIGMQRAQSEPYLFMFGDNIYVYRPCEPIKKTSVIALCNDYHTSLPPCQSIDLKFPVDESNIKICDWDGIPERSPQNISQIENKDDELSSFTSNESITYRKSSYKCNTDCNQYITSQNRYLLNSKIHDQDQKIQFPSKGNTPYFDISLRKVSMAAESDKRVAFNSIGVQADICEAEAKSMLIEQLQGHLTSAIKEVELKDQALSNLEKKLNISRQKCSVLKEKIESFNADNEQLITELESFRLENDNMKLKVLAKEDKLKELSEEQKILQKEKRALMTEIEFQNQTIRNLQEAIVQSKRSSDNASARILSSTTNVSSTTLSDIKHSSRGSIIDV